METGGCIVTQVDDKFLYNGKDRDQFTGGNLTKGWHAYNALCLFLNRPDKMTRDKMKPRALCITCD